MTITRETLELAALAIGGKFSPGTAKKRTGATWDEWEWQGPIGIAVGGIVTHPQLDIGAAARLAVRLSMLVDVSSHHVRVIGPMKSKSLRHDGTQPDAERAYCEAVTLCAAEASVAEQLNAARDRMRAANVPTLDQIRVRLMATPEVLGKVRNCMSCRCGPDGCSDSA